MARGKRFPSASKAKMMLEEGTARGKNLTGKQKRFFGMLAGGKKPTKMGYQKRKMKKGGSYYGKRNKRVSAAALG